MPKTMHTPWPGWLVASPSKPTQATALTSLPPGSLSQSLVALWVIGGSCQTSSSPSPHNSSSRGRFYFRIYRPINAHGLPLLRGAGLLCGLPAAWGSPNFLLTPSPITPSLICEPSSTVIHSSSVCSFRSWSDLHQISVGVWNMSKAPGPQRRAEP